MSKNENIQSQLEVVQNILEASYTAVNEMKDGERMQIKHLAEVVGLALAMSPKDVLVYVNSYAHNTNIAYVSRGKNGGIVKGQKADKPVKKAKKADSKSV